jgi:tRNA modification GTPase
LEGRLGERIRALREALVELLAHVEAFIDFPDEDIDPATGEARLAKLDAVRSEIDALLATADRGKVLREGVRTVIYGAPNVGKSSLLNLLLGQERAIVSARPGTTRDVIEETINLRGLPLRLIDTAGLRESEDEIEREGMSRTRRELERADLALHVFDASQGKAADFNAEGAEEMERDAEGSERSAIPFTPPLRASASSAPSALKSAAEVVHVLNKTDLGEHASWAGTEAVRMSCLRGEGIEALADEIVARVNGGAAAHRDWALAINARHADCLRRARGLAEAARTALTEGLSPEFVAEELRGVLEAVGEIAGKADSEEILGKIFRTFCIGK